jgi:hypothetical protein
MVRESQFTDRHTGFPFLIVPHWTAKEIEDGVTRRGRGFDLHHLRFRRRDARLLHGASSLAVRHSYVQLMDRDYHERYHDEAGLLWLPTTEDEKFTAVVASLARFIPEYGVDMGSRKTRFPRLNWRQVRRFRLGNELRIESEPRLQKYVAEYLLAHELEFSGVHGVAQEFLCAKPETKHDWERQAGRAVTLLAVAAREPAEQIASMYNFGYEHNLLAPNAPSSPADFIVSTLVKPNVYEMRPLIQRLGDRLLQAANGVSIPPGAVA